MNDMASSSGRKKLDEYHLKILRELLTLPPNKYCFDCHQRGPTYVNVTIGSFVCTKCSGMLRGLTPPHRVKSVTMATFSPEEMELIKTRGNEYCKKIWLGLYENEVPTKDEQQIKDFMFSKYEKKRYYIDPSTLSMMNGSVTPSSVSSNSSSAQNSPSSQSLSDASSGKLNQKILNSQQSRPNTFSVATANNNNNAGVNNLSNGSNNHQQSFIADFSSPGSSVDPFNSSLESSTNSETSFADFENNPVFCSPSQTSVKTGTNKDFDRPLNAKETVVEDKYAALKDLDFMMKSQMLEKQKQQMLQQNLSNGNVWPNVFPTIPNGTVSEPVTPFNPFGNNATQWIQQNNYDVNPFYQAKLGGWNDNDQQWKSASNFNVATNQNMAMNASRNGWITTNGNPFKVNGLSQPNGQHHSSNPFL